MTEHAAPGGEARAVLDALREGVGVIDADGRLADVSAGLCAMTGFSAEELVGALPPFPFWPEEEAGAIDAALREALTGRRGTFELTFRRKSGERFPVLVDVGALPDVGGRPGMLCAARDITEQVRERERLAASEARLREAQEVAALSDWEWDPTDDRLTVSGWLERWSGVAPGTVPTLVQGLAFVAPEHRDRLLSDLRAVARDGAPYSGRVKIAVPNADLAWVEVRARRFEHGHGVSVHGTAQDVTEQVRSSEEAYVRARLLDEVDGAVVATDLDLRVTHWSRGAERLYGWTSAEAVGRRATELLADCETGAQVFDAMLRSVRETGRWEGEVEARRKDGSPVDAYVRTSAIEDESGRPSGLVGVGVDLAPRIKAERDLRAARDYLRAVTDSMGEGLITVDQGGRIMYVNRAAEELLGWSAGELLGRRLHETTHHHRPDGSPYPASECPMVHSRTAGEHVRIDDDLFFRKDGTPLPVEFTSSPIEMEGGARGAVVVFNDITERKREQERVERDLEALRWLTRIREALRRDRFVLHAQPIVDLATGETIQHELLIRMLDEDGGLVPPGDFLPVAEQYGLVREIDRWVIRRAAAVAGAGHPVELNISADSLSDPDLHAEVERELRRAGADPRSVVIEITETALLKNPDAGRDFILRVAPLGCQVALDDFGTGYGGLMYVKRLPVDFLKIDIEFVRDLPRDTASQHVVRAIVQLARDFGHRTVAEGVEDAETLDVLRELGVDFAQGYWLGRPEPVESAGLLTPGGR